MRGRWVDLDGDWLRARITAARAKVARLRAFPATAVARDVLESEFYSLCGVLDLLMDELDRAALPLPGTCQGGGS